MRLLDVGLLAVLSTSCGAPSQEGLAPLGGDASGLSAQTQETEGSDSSTDGESAAGFDASGLSGTVVNVSGTLDVTSDDESIGAPAETNKIALSSASSPLDENMLVPVLQSEEVTGSLHNVSVTVSHHDEPSSNVSESSTGDGEVQIAQSPLGTSSDSTFEPDAAGEPAYVTAPPGDPTPTVPSDTFEPDMAVEAEYVNGGQAGDDPYAAFAVSDTFVVRRITGHRTSATTQYLEFEAEVRQTENYRLDGSTCYLAAELEALIDHEDGYYWDILGNGRNFQWSEGVIHSDGSAAVLVTFAVDVPANLPASAVLNLKCKDLSGGGK